MRLEAIIVSCSLAVYLWIVRLVFFVPFVFFFDRSTDCNLSLFYLPKDDKKPLTIFLSPT